MDWLVDDQLVLDLVAAGDVRVAEFGWEARGDALTVECANALLPAVRAAAVALGVLVAGAWGRLLVVCVWIVLRAVVGVALLIAGTSASAITLIIVIIVVVVIRIGILHTIRVGNRRIWDDRRSVVVLVMRDEGRVDIWLTAWVNVHVALGAE